MKKMSEQMQKQMNGGAVHWFHPYAVHVQHVMSHIQIGLERACEIGERHITKRIILKKHLIVGTT